MNREEEKEYQEKMGSPEMEYLQYLSEQKPTEEEQECPLKGRMGQCSDGKCFHLRAEEQ